jgi:hypothetical protein
MKGTTVLTLRVLSRSVLHAECEVLLARNHSGPPHHRTACHSSPYYEVIYPGGMEYVGQGTALTPFRSLPS